MISLQNLCKSFAGQVVVDDLSLSVARGEIVALLGPTGSGKSTIVSLILGQLAPSSGDVRVNGLDPRLHAKALRGKIAVSFQTDRLLPWRTAIENVELGLEILGVARPARRSASAEWLLRVQLDAFHHAKYPHQLSGGMRQRVSLARALVVQPELILLDESFSQLDHGTSKVLRNDFSRLARQLGKTCLLITHRIEDALEMADRVIVLTAPARIRSEIAITSDQRLDRSWMLHAADDIALMMVKGDSLNLQ